MDTKSTDIGAALLFDCGFGRELLANAMTAGTVSAHIIDAAGSHADAAGNPVGVWVRDGWATICEIAPELLPIDPARYGWEMWAVIDPTGAEW